MGQYEVQITDSRIPDAKLQAGECGGIWLSRGDNA
jgi:hypothetical protein